MSRLGLAAALLLLRLPAYSQEESQDIEATLSQVQGTVYLHTADQKEDEFIQAEENAPLAAGDHIRTGTDGSAEIALADHSVIELNRNTDFILNSLDPKETEFHLGIGSFVAKLKKLLEGDNMTFHTPTAIAAVRGTELAVSQESDSEPTRVGVFDEGRVAVRSQNGKEEIPVGPGEETEVQRKGPPAKARPMQALLSHRQFLVQARTRLAALPGLLRRTPAQRQAARQALAQRRAFRAGALANVRKDMQRRNYNHLKQRRQMLRQRRQQRQKKSALQQRKTQQKRRAQQQQRRQQPQRRPFQRKAQAAPFRRRPFFKKKGK